MIITSKALEKAVRRNIKLGVKVKAILLYGQVNILTHDKNAETWRHDVLRLDVSDLVKNLIVKKLNRK